MSEPMSAMVAQPRMVPAVRVALSRRMMRLNSRSLVIVFSLF